MCTAVRCNTSGSHLCIGYTLIQVSLPSIHATAYIYIAHSLWQQPLAPGSNWQYLAVGKLPSGQEEKGSRFPLNRLDATQASKHGQARGQHPISACRASLGVRCHKCGDYRRMCNAFMHAQIALQYVWQAYCIVSSTVLDDTVCSAGNENHRVWPHDLCM